MAESRIKAVKKYNEYKKKYGLPSLKELEEEFDFELNETSGIISQVLGRMWDRILKVKLDLEGIFHPQQYCCLIEHKFFTGKEKKELFNTYKKIMTQYWITIKANYISKEERIKQISKNYEFYKKLKPIVRKYLTRYIKKWSEKGKKELREGYIS